MNKILTSLPLALSILAAGCSCANPWAAFPEKRTPDHQVRVGDGVQGNVIYSWDCLDGQHVVITQTFAEWACSEPKRETAACGQMTPTEQRLAGKPQTPAPVRWQ